jgi:hypothetical protein
MLPSVIIGDHDVSPRKAIREVLESIAEDNLDLLAVVM